MVTWCPWPGAQAVSLLVAPPGPPSLEMGVAGGGGSRAPAGPLCGLDRHCWPLLSGATSMAPAPLGWTDLSERRDQLTTDPHPRYFSAHSRPRAGPGACTEARQGGGWSPLVSGRKWRPAPTWQTRTWFPPGLSGPASRWAGQAPDARRLDGDMEHSSTSAWSCAHGPWLASMGAVGLAPAAVGRAVRTDRAQEQTASPAPGSALCFPLLCFKALGGVRGGAGTPLFQGRPGAGRLGLGSVSEPYSH